MRAAIGVAIIVVACSGLAQGQSPPATSEVVRLRSGCAELGKNMLRPTTIGSALTKHQTSYYDPQAKRCYVDLTVRSADVSDKYINRNLFDGQTNELLAIARIEKEKTTGMVFDEQQGNLKYARWDEASAYIDAKMARKRK